MRLTNNLLYLLLLFAVLDKENRLNVTNGMLIALGIMLLNFFCRPVVKCRDDGCCPRRGMRIDPFYTMNDFDSVIGL